MREILFRGKETESGRWYYGGFFPHKKTTYCFKEDYEAHPENDEPCIVFDEPTDWGLPNTAKCATVIAETVGQYTGLKDKNGKKIFEGDVFKFPDEVWESSYTSCGTEYDSWGVENYGVVGFHEDTQAPDFVGYKFTENQVEADLHENHSMEFFDFVGSLEIIGNIFDNPELLEVIHSGD